MFDPIPTPLALAFILVTLITLWLLLRCFKHSDSELTQRKLTVVLLVTGAWLLLQAILTIQGVYEANPSAFPPKIMLFGVFPAIGCLLTLFASKRGRQLIDSLPLADVTCIHSVRIAVELILLGLYMHHLVPRLMTFEGWNFDILAGISALPVAYLGIKKAKLNRLLLLLWNFISLVLLLTIVLLAVFSAPSAFQQLAFDEPNIALFYFPVSWLPTFIVPIVLFSHLIAIRRLIVKKSSL